MWQRSQTEIAVYGVLQRAGQQEAVAAVSEETAAALRRGAAEALELLSAEAAVTPAAAEAVCALSRGCLAAGSEAGLCCEAVAELVCEGLAAAAGLFAADGGDGAFQPMDGAAGVAYVVLESLSAVLDSFTIEIFAGLRRLEELLRPTWVLAGGGRGGRVCLGAPDAPGSDAVEVRLHQALQGVCAWALCLLVRMVGYDRFDASCLWEFASLSHDCVVLAQGALCFQQNQRELTHVRAPGDLHRLRAAVLGAVLGLAAPEVVFAGSSDEGRGDITMEERHELLTCHRALLASAAADCGLLDCVLAFPWGSDLRVALAAPALASLLAALAGPAEERCELVELVRAWTQQVRDRGEHVWDSLVVLAPPTRGFLRDCAALSRVVPPPASAAATLLRRSLAAESPDSAAVLADDAALAALAALVANGGCSPDPLLRAAAGLPPERLLQLDARLRSWPGPVRAGELDRLRAALLAGAGAAEPEPPAPPAPEQRPAAGPPVGGRAFGLERGGAPGLAELVDAAPPEFCCALDKRLLMDPVRSPAGHAFERTSLQRALAASGGRCPLTAAPLALADCQRDGALRGRVLAWVRGSRPKGPSG